MGLRPDTLRLGILELTPLWRPTSVEIVRKLNVQVVWAHPRGDSLTATITQDVIEELKHAGATVDEVDLYRLGFDPILREIDEPDWDDLDKQYSPEVMRHTSKTREADAVIFVFPVWWYSLPAIMKGYIDRVWNYGTFYGGGRRIGLGSVLWLGLAGETLKFYQKRNYDEMMAHSLNVSIAGYCGVDDSRMELLYNTLGSDIDDMGAHFAELREIARGSVRSLMAS